MSGDVLAPDLRSGVIEGARRGLPFAIGTVLFGLSFGVLARSHGWGVLAPVAMSATTWGGSAQFAALTIAGSGGATTTAILAAALLNARYLAMSAALAPSLTGGRLVRALAGLAIVDESWAIAAHPEGGFDLRRLAGVALLLYPGWILGTAGGVLLGGLLGDPKRFGLDAAFPALFLAIVAPWLRTPRSRVASALGVAIALAATPLTPPGVPICLACTAALIGLRRP